MFRVCVLGESSGADTGVCCHVSVPMSVNRIGKVSVDS